ncbi:MAG: hypothetical protein HETSPECPRED_005343 [Heterodermia speciosa]|uniref:Uncharacterized protein n=1 Tax=Heterodermia speciosa TaxID=116794 RepID=A0A8H3IJT6_9LECA|nr:MAG: hypothetical protein HETSPECPRED_005343 [Heterodermia speciosa]
MSGQAGGQQEDYLDKGLDAAEKKFGQGKIDPAKQRSLNEKITDKATGFFEKATGYAINPCSAFSLPLSDNGT